jgi:hypothetical protein
MKVKPRELQMRQLTNVRQKDKRKGGVERRLAAAMRDISFDTRTTPFSATIVDNTRWRRASPRLFSLLDV